MKRITTDEFMASPEYGRVLDLEITGTEVLIRQILWQGRAGYLLADFSRRRVGKFRPILDDWAAYPMSRHTPKTRRTDLARKQMVSYMDECGSRIAGGLHILRLAWGELEDLCGLIQDAMPEGSCVRLIAAVENEKEGTK